MLSRISYQYKIWIDFNDNKFKHQYGTNTKGVK